MAKAMRSGVEGWQAFVGVAPFLLGAFRWLSLFLECGVCFFLLVVGGWLVFLRVWSWSFLLGWPFLLGVRYWLCLLRVGTGPSLLLVKGRSAMPSLSGGFGPSRT